jgi:transcriptional regulator with XRE-family HTH domain
MKKSAGSRSKMGARLMELRTKSGLTQDQVGERMGLTFAHRDRQVGALEAGRNDNPTINVLTRYLRAVGAQWSDISYLLDQREVPPIPHKQVEKAAETLAVKSKLIPELTFRPKLTLAVSPIEKVISETRSATQSYQEAIASPRSGAPRTVEVQKKAVRNFQEYRLQANVVRLKLRRLLGGYPISVIDFTGYQVFGSKVHSAMRALARTKDPVKGEKLLTEKLAEAQDFIRDNRLNAAIAEKVAAVVKEVLENWQAQPPTANG